MIVNNTTGLTRIIEAAGCLWRGFRAAWTSETAFRQEGIATTMVIAIVCWLDVDATTRILPIGSVLLMIIVEILNSATEAVMDRIGLEYHKLSGHARDMESAAAPLAIITVSIAWGTLLWSHCH